MKSINHKTASQRRILFIYDGSLSFVNQHVSDLLARGFDSCEVDTFDIKANIKQKKRFFLINAIFFMWEYRADILFRYKDTAALKSSLFVTTYMQKKVKKTVARMVANGNYLFTFQTQSQYDASVPDIPHYIYTDHTLRANFLYPNIDYRNFLKPNKYLLHTERKIYERASLIFTYSNNIKDSLLNQYSIAPSRVATVGVGYGIETPKTINPKKYDSKNILFVGVDWNRKGGKLLVEAFKVVQQQVADATLTIVGCRPVIDDTTNVNVVGRVPLSEVSQLYEQAAVFCMPSHREPFGLVYLEAMIHHLPIVGLPIGVLPELVSQGENGYLTQAHAEALAERLVYLVQQPEICQRMGKEGAKIVHEWYEWDKVGTRLVQHIKKDLQERGASVTTPDTLATNSYDDEKMPSSTHT